jgi:biotin--protein ligase
MQRPAGAAATPTGARAAAAAAAPPPRAPPRRARVAVYRGEGAGWRSVQSTVASLARLLPREHYEVVTLAPAELVAGGWQAACALLVMPGGADLPYCKRLNGTGNALIRGAAAHSGWGWASAAAAAREGGAGKQYSAPPAGC